MDLTLISNRELGEGGFEGEGGGGGRQRKKEKRGPHHVPMFKKGGGRRTSPNLFCPGRPRQKDKGGWGKGVRGERRTRANRKHPKQGAR